MFRRIASALRHGGLKKRILILKFNKAAIATALLAVTLAACAQTPQQQGAGTGALIGGAGGALVGQAIGGNTKSTMIGAASGALLGAVVGSSMAPNQRGEEMCRYRAANGSVYVDRCDERYYNGRY